MWASAELTGRPSPFTIPLKGGGGSDCALSFASKLTTVWWSSEPSKVGRGQLTLQNRRVCPGRDRQAGLSMCKLTVFGRNFEIRHKTRDQSALFDRLEVDLRTKEAVSQNPVLLARGEVGVSGNTVPVLLSCSTRSRSFKFPVTNATCSGIRCELQTRPEVLSASASPGR